MDDTLTWEVCHQPVKVNSSLQHRADEVVAWTNVNRMQLNASKTKEMLISFTRQVTVVLSILMNGEVVKRVTTAKLLSVIISSNLSWSEHMDFITSKGSQRIYSLCLLRRARASEDDILCLYKAFVRAVLEYACTVWHILLSTEQSDQIEHLQKSMPRASFTQMLHTMKH